MDTGGEKRYTTLLKGSALMSSAVSKPPRPQAVVEAIFDIVYLLFAVTAGCVMLARAGGESRVLALYGALALVLGCGDAFHLIPRILGSLRGDMAARTRSLGFGKLVTSLTMTVFYVLLYEVWSAYYGLVVVRAAVYTLAALRVGLCLLPQNGWLHEEAPVKWAILRNVPFALLGAVIVGIFAVTAVPAGDLFRFIPLAVVLSFAFYLPVVLWSKKYPALGALMLPKTATYVWIICMGFGLA